MFRQFSIGVRASAAFAIIGLLVLALGIFALNRLAAVTDQMDFITDEQVPAVDNVNDLDREFLRVRIHSANVTNFINDPQRLSDYREKLDDAIQSLKRNQREYAEAIENTEAREKFNQYMALDKEYWARHDQFEKLVDAQLYDPIISLRENRILPLTDEISVALDELLALEMALIADATEQAGNVATSAKIGVITALIVALILMIVFAFVLTRSIIMPIRQAVEFAKTIAARDLTANVDIDGDDEATVLLKQLQRTQNELRESIAKISESSEQLASTSEELSSVTDDSTRTIQQQKLRQPQKSKRTSHATLIRTWSVSVICLTQQHRVPSRPALPVRNCHAWLSTSTVWSRALKYPNPFTITSAGLMASAINAPLKY